ncbi:ABC transporter substrate-binding protein [bacterium]|nr:ABC transporter substrate-binding protein [bacterium]
MIKKTLLSFFCITLLAQNAVQASSFSNIKNLKAYTQAYEEYPEIDNDNWTNPNYTSFYKKNIPGWFNPIFRFLRLSKQPIWEEKAFKTILQNVIKQRENNGYMGRFVIKMTPKSDSRFIIFGDLHASFHSFVRNLEHLQNERIINNNLKIKDGYYFVFNGNAIDLSPFNLEILNLIAHIMDKNPQQVFYIRGQHEDKEHWRNFSLRTELELRAENIKEKLIKRFFNTLPLALYLTGLEGKKTEVIRISYFNRNYKELNEDNFADFFILDDEEQEGEVTVRNLEVKTTVPKAINIKTIIKSEDRLIKQTTTEGLIQADSEKGATSWMVLSAPNRTFRSLYKFFFDAFAMIKTNGKISNWTISLYNQDVREQIGIKKRKEYSLVSGDLLSGQTRQVKTLKKQVVKLEQALQSCKSRTKIIETKTKTPTKSSDNNQKELELAKKEAMLAKKEAELSKKEAAVAQSMSKKVEPEKEEIIIGTTLGLTGNIKEESENVRLGLQLRFDKLNQQGGINGKKIRLVVLDDGYNPNNARKNALELINKYKAEIILLPTGSATTKAYLDLVKDKKVAVLFTTSGSPALRTPTPEYFIHFRPSYPAMAEALLSYAQTTLEAKKYALITQSDVTAAEMVTTIKKAGIKQENFIEVTHKRNITDMSKQAQEVKKFKPDALILWTTSAASMALIKEMGAENLIDTKMLGADLRNAIFDEFLKNMGLTNNYIDAQAIPNPQTSNLPILQEYRTVMGTKQISGLSAEAYICASIFIHLLKQTNGSTDKAKIIKAAESITAVDLGGIKLNFEKKDRRLSQFIWLSTGEPKWIAVDVQKLEAASAKKTAQKIKKPTPEKITKVKKEETKEEKDFIIGSTLDLSKSLKLEGEKMREGLDIYVRKINREGGVRGRNVKLIVLDDGYDPEQAKENVKTLLEKHKADIILSSLGSPTTAGYLDEYIKTKKVLVAFPFTGSPVLRDPSYSNLLHLTPPYDQIELALFKYGLEKLKAKKFALFAQSDEMTEGVKKILDVAGIKKENWTFLGYERNTTDFSKQVKDVEEFKPQAIVLLSTSRAATEFLRQVGVEDLVGKKIMGIQLGDLTFKQFIKQQGLEKQFFDIQTVPNPESDLPILKEYRELMGNKQPDAYSAVAYVAAAIFFDILKRVEGPLTHKNIIATAEKTKKYNLGGLNLNFEPSSRTGLNYIWFDTGKKGDWEQMEVKPKKLK